MYGVVLEHWEVVSDESTPQARVSPRLPPSNAEIAVEYNSDVRGSAGCVLNGQENTDHGAEERGERTDTMAFTLCIRYASSYSHLCLETYLQ